MSTGTRLSQFGASTGVQGETRASSHPSAPPPPTHPRRSPPTSPPPHHTPTPPPPGVWSKRTPVVTEGFTCSEPLLLTRRCMLMASLEPRQGGGSDGSARGGDTRNGASLQHWRRPPTTALRAVGGLSSTTPHGDRRPPVRLWRERCVKCTTSHGNRSHFCRGCGQSSCLLLSGRRRDSSGRVCPCSRFPLLTPVVMGQEAAHDDCTVAWLLARSLAEA